jgi:ribokinase
MAKAARVLVIGSANMDFTVAVPRLPSEGETITGGRFYVSHGGKGANQAVAARRLGAEVRFVGCVGRIPRATRSPINCARKGFRRRG